jgi:hypothetical protein
VIQAFAVDWAAGGPEAIARVRVTGPSTYMRVVASILPKDILIGIENRLPGGLDPEDWNMLTRIVGVVRELAPTASGDQIEDALRSALAKPVVDVN